MAISFLRSHGSGFNLESNMTETEFLIGLALRKFNRQFGTTIKTNECAIRSLSSVSKDRLAYEIETLRTDDFVRLRMYLTFGVTDGLQNFSLESDGSNGVGTLTDEVYVALGTLALAHKMSGEYKFRPIGGNIATASMVAMEDGTIARMEDGTAWLMEG